MEKNFHWGDLDSEVEESSDESIEEEREKVEVPPTIASNLDVDEEPVINVNGGTQSVVSGFASSLPSGLETPDVIDLRKTIENPKQLCIVLEQKETNIKQGQIMGSEHVYVIPDSEKEKWPVGSSNDKKKYN